MAGNVGRFIISGILILFGGFLISLVFTKGFNRAMSRINKFVIRINSSIWDEIFKKTSNPIKKWEENLQRMGELNAKAFFSGVGFISIIAGILYLLNFFKY